MAIKKVLRNELNVEKNDGKVYFKVYPEIFFKPLSFSRRNALLN